MPEYLGLVLLVLLVEVLLIDLNGIWTGLEKVVMLLHQRLLIGGRGQPEHLLHMHHLLLVICERELRNLMQLLLLLNLLLLDLGNLDLLRNGFLSRLLNGNCNWLTLLWLMVFFYA